MQDINLSNKIDQFWAWFQQNEHLFKEVVDPQAVREAMDNQILEFGAFSWEIGEGKSKPYYLIISPNRDAKLFQFTMKIVEAAPPMRDWEFFDCKPAKAWDYQFEMYDRFNLRQRFNASEWEYVLFKKPDDYVEIIIRADNLQSLDVDDRLAAGELALTYILGEELVIGYLQSLEIVAELEPELESICHKIPTLKFNFEKAMTKI